MSELTTGQCIFVFVVGSLLSYAILSPWFALNSIRDIAKELREIKELIEKERRAE